MYPLSPTSLPCMNYIKALYSKGLRSSTSPGVIIKLRSSPFSLQIKCNLKPKNQPIEPELGYIASSFVREDIFGEQMCS